MEQQAALLGCVVRSLAGRDAGRVYLVLRVIDPHRVALADGWVRPADNLKRKNAKHLEVLGTSEAIARNLARGGRISDSEIRQVLEGFETAGSGGRDPDV